MSAAEWRDVPGYEGCYQVSSDGQVKSLGRVITHKDGRPRTVSERILQPGPSQGYLSVSLADPRGRGKTAARSYKIHQLVALAFLGGKPFDGAEVCHSDGNKLNNRPENLRWDTRAANIRDAVNHGGNHNISKTRCVHGHEFTVENTRWYRSGIGGRARSCRTCERDRKQADRVTRLGVSA